jgi:hypothetical protein
MMTTGSLCSFKYLGKNFHMLFLKFFTSLSVSSISPKVKSPCEVLLICYSASLACSSIPHIAAMVYGPIHAQFLLL